jgi:diguanylate cyclase (GGDEF)-like protein
MRGASQHIALRRPGRLAGVLGACLLAVCTTAGPAAAATLSMQFTRLGSDEGLSQGAITSIVQDSEGYLWLGTEDGLIRYDGYDIQHLYHDRDQPNGLPNNWVSSMAVDNGGRLWIGTDGGGIVRYDPADTRFHVPVGRDGTPLLDPEARVRQVFVAHDGRLWITTRSRGLFLLDPDAGQARQFHHDPADDGSLSDDSVFRVAEGPDGAIWIGTLSGLDRLDPQSGHIERLGARLRTLIGQSQPSPINALHVDQRGLLWVGTNFGLVRLDTATHEMSRFVHGSATGGSSLPDDRVLAILEDDERRLWVGTGGGLALVDRRTDHVGTVRHTASDRLSLPDDTVIALFQDRGGLLWVGTKFGGAARWNPRSWSFGHQRLGDDGADNVAAFAEDRMGTLWVGTFGNGLYAVDREGGGITRYRHDLARADSIGDNNIMAIVVDDRDRIWFGTMGAGVERLDPRSGSVTRFAYDAGDPHSLSAPGVMSMLRDSQGRIWVGTYGGGVNRIDAATGRVHRYPLAGDGGLSNDRATALAEDRTGLIWIGTDGGGLNVLDPASGRLRAFRHDAADPRSLSADIVYSVHEDERGRIWVGTRGGGLNRVSGAPFSQQGLTFENFSESDGLPNSTVYGIESDRGGHLWLSTNRGLSKLDPDSRTIVNFHRSHGLQADEFNFGAHYRNPAGELFFGGSGGYNAFFPERLRFNDKPPPVVLTAMLKLNQPVDFRAAQHGGTAMHLAYQDDVVTFRFAALDYTDPDANRYRYMLEGFDRDWVDASDSRQATYTNLGGGHYTFRVRAANSDGEWNEAGLSVPLSVEYPPWQRWWALVGYVGALVLLLYSVWAAQQRKLVREAAYASRLADEVRARTAELAERNSELQDLNEQLREASVTDALTGVGNRRSLREAVTRLVAATEPDRAEKSDTCRLVLMVVDLDRLKPINDGHGHEAGDRVLKQVAEILRNLCRNNDHVSRWGGDEFVVMCRDADLAAASALAERIRDAVAKQIFRVGEGTAARTSCSIGFATYPFVAEAPDLLSWEQTLALADAALYQAKSRRNNWIGWTGTARAATLEDLFHAVETDPETLEKDGVIEVRRRPTMAGEDTVDRLLSLGSSRDP